MPLTTKLAPDASLAPRPATAKKKSRLRLLVPCGDRLPPGVLLRLKRSPIEVLAVHPSLSGLVLRRSDVVLLGDARRLAELKAALERNDALTTPVVALGAEAGNGHGLRVERLEPASTPEATADAVLRTVVKLLKPLGGSREDKPGDSSETAAVDELPSESSPRPAAPPVAAPPVAAPPVAVAPANDTAAPPDTAARSHPAIPAPIELPKAAPLPIFSIGTPTRANLLPEVPLALGTDPAASAKLSRSLMPEAFSIQGSRWIVLDDDVARAHATATCLTSQGGVVEVTGSQPNENRLGVLRSFDAVGVLVADAALERLGPLLGAFQRDPRLRWVRVVPVRFSELYDERSSRLDAETLKLLLLPHWQVEHDTVRDLLASQSVPIDHVGLAKLLRAGARLQSRMDLFVECPLGRFEIALADGQLLAVGRDGVPAEPHETRARLVELLSLDEGSARLERNRQSRGTSPIGRVEQLLEQCASAARALTFSVPPAAPFAASVPPGAPFAASAPPFAVQSPAPSAAPDPGYDEDVLTVPLDRQEFVRQGYIPGGTEPSASSRAAPGRFQHFGENARRALPRARLWLLREAVEPLALWARNGLRDARPWIRAHKPLSIGAGALALSAVIGITVVIARSDPDTARAAEAEAVAKRELAPVAAATANPAASASQAAAELAGAPVDGSEPPASGDLAALLDGPAERPDGCERWVGSEPVARQAKQATAAWRMARKSLMRGDDEQAEQRLCLSLHLDSRGPGTLDLIRFQLQKRNIEGAKAWARWALRERPRDPEPKQLLADAVHQEGNEPMARALLLESMNLTAADTSVITNVANRYAGAGFRALEGADPAQADRLFRRATTLDPRHALGMAGRARVALGAGDVRGATAHAERSVELDPKLFEAHLALGDAYQKQGDAAKARTAWLTAAALKPGTRETRERLGL